MLLTATGVGIFQVLTETQINQKILPFMHVEGNPRVIQIDYNNTFGYGHRAILNPAIDMRKILVIADSIQSFLEDHVVKLRKNWYMSLRRNIETYALNPTDQGAYGSMTITKGVKVTAVAHYNHIISQFHSAT